MDFLSGLAKKATSGEPAPENKENSSNYDVFSSAKVVAGAAQSQFSNQPEKYDKAKVAGASADLLGAASDYGKVDDTQGFGKYVNQAEGYLRQYDAPKTTPTTTTPADDVPNPDSGYQNTTTADAPAADYGDDKVAAVPVGDDSDYAGKRVAPPTETTEAENPSFGGGDYTKEAEGFSNKPSSYGGAEEVGDGDYIKKSEGFSSKPLSYGGAEEVGDGDYIKKSEGFSSKPSSYGGTEEVGDGDYIKKSEGFSNKPSDATDEGVAGDYTEKPSYGGAEGTGDYTEKAEGFLNKPSEGEGEGEGGGAGEYFKKAGDFLNKPSEDGEDGEYSNKPSAVKKAAGFY